MFDLQLEQKQVVPPFKPRLEGERDLANFPPEFTDEPVHLTPDNEYVGFFCSLVASAASCHRPCPSEALPILLTTNYNYEKN